MLDTQRYFVNSAQGKEASLPSPTPPQLLGPDPVKDLEAARDEMIETFSRNGVIERTGPAIGIAFTDALVHGWDLAKATGQDTGMPEGLAEAAYQTIHGRLTAEQRKGGFKPELRVANDASAQERLLAYTGRQP
jgi:uncharacterized protein (TIGR03086 family)